MASDILKLIIDADSSGAVREFQKLGAGIKSSVGDAEKATTGFKGAITKAFDGLQAKSATASGLFQKVGASSEQAAGLISAAIPAAGVAAAGALVAFAAKGVKAFQETALAAGKFADSTGLSVDSASRYIAVADDIGVGASTIQSAFVKMEKAMGANKSAFADLVVTTKSGGTDLDATFLKAITHLQGIKDPIERATESSKLFGKGFSEVSQIIGTDADTLKAKLASVSSAQVISDAELKKAREYQAAMDNLKDAVRDVSIQLGSALVPALSDAANGMASFITGAQKANQKSGGLLGDLLGSARDALDPIQHVRDSWKQLQDAFGSSKTEEAAGGFNVLAAAIGGVQKGADQAAAGTPVIVNALTAASSAVDALNTKLSDSQAVNSFIQGSSGIGRAMEQQAASLKAANDALATHTNLILAAEGGVLAVGAATREFNKAVEDNNKVQKDAKATTDEKAAALDRETSSAIATAQATVDYAKKQEEASGKTLDAKAANDILISTLYTLASKSSPEVQAALGDVITKLQDVGAEHPNPTVDATDNASSKLGPIHDSLEALKGGASIPVGANTSAAKAAINALINGLNSISGITGKKFATIATGTRNFAGGLALVGEQGPEMVYLPQGSAVSTAAKTQKIMEGGPSPITMTGGNSGGTVFQITVNGAVDPYSTARQIQTILAKGGYAGFSAKAA
jgi:hypothetical protein